MARKKKSAGRKKIAKKKPAKKEPAKKKPAPKKKKPATAKPEFVGIESHPLKPASDVLGLNREERGKLEGILERYDRSDAALLAILQDIQEQNNYLPRPWMESLADELKIPRTRIYRLATFFKSLSLEPRGKHICTVCIGTTCHVRGAPKLVDKVELEMDVKAGETTEDMLFTMETVGCVGACALGPLVVLDKEYHGNLTVEGLGRILKKVKKERKG